jgi:hypothetical protein
MRDTGGDTKSLNALNPELDDAAAAAVGTVIDRLGFGSATIATVFGATAGSPDSVDYVLKLQEGDLANGSDMADVVGETVNSPQDPAAGSVVEHNVRLAARKRYIRWVATGTIPGGSSPTIGISAVITLGEAKTLPAV